MPMGGLATSMMGALCVPPCPSIKRRMLFIANMLPMCCVACYVFFLLAMRCPYVCLCAWLIVGLLCCYPLLDMLALCLLDAT